MKSEHGGFVMKIIQPVDWVKRQFGQARWIDLLHTGVYTLGNKVSILQMCPEKKIRKNLNSNIIRLLLHNCTIKNTSHGYNQRKLPDNYNNKMHQS